MLNLFSVLPIERLDISVSLQLGDMWLRGPEPDLEVCSSEVFFFPLQQVFGQGSLRSCALRKWVVFHIKVQQKQMSRRKGDEGAGGDCACVYSTWFHCLMWLCVILCVLLLSIWTILDVLWLSYKQPPHAPPTFSLADRVSVSQVTEQVVNTFMTCYQAPFNLYIPEHPWLSTRLPLHK